MLSGLDTLEDLQQLRTEAAAGPPLGGPSEGPLEADMICRVATIFCTLQTANRSAARLLSNCFAIGHAELLD